jgi:hypothetical protein
MITGTIYEYDTKLNYKVLVHVLFSHFPEVVIRSGDLIIYAFLFFSNRFNNDWFLRLIRSLGHINQTAEYNKIKLQKTVLYLSIVLLSGV